MAVRRKGTAAGLLVPRPPDAMSLQGRGGPGRLHIPVCEFANTAGKSQSSNSAPVASLSSSPPSCSPGGSFACCQAAHPRLLPGCIPAFRRAYPVLSEDTHFSQNKWVCTGCTRTSSIARLHSLPYSWAVLSSSLAGHGSATWVLSRAQGGSTGHDTALMARYGLINAAPNR